MPVAHRSRRRAGRLGGFANIVAASPLDAARAVSTIGHRLAAQAFDQCANIFDAPSGRFRPEFHRLWKAPVPDALPPCALADGDGAVGREDRRKADEAALRKGLKV